MVPNHEKQYENRCRVLFLRRHVRIRVHEQRQSVAPGGMRRCHGFLGRRDRMDRDDEKKQK